MPIHQHSVLPLWPLSDHYPEEHQWYMCLLGEIILYVGTPSLAYQRQKHSTILLLMEESVCDETLPVFRKTWNKHYNAIYKWTTWRCEEYAAVWWSALKSDGSFDNVRWSMRRVLNLQMSNYCESYEFIS